MIGFLIFIHAVVSLFLIAVVLMQASQGGGLSGTFGGNAASSVLGGQNAGNVLSRITTWLATVFLILALVIAVFTKSSQQESTSIAKRAAEGRAPASPTEMPVEDPKLNVGGE